ncbi:MAG: energy-coupling factor transporter transmembrane component T [Nitrososphaerota archaeon]
MSFEYGLYSPGKSIMHKLDPRAKIIWAVVVLAFSIYNGNYLLSPIYGAVIYASVIIALIISRPPAFWLKLVGILTVVILFFSLIFWPASAPRGGVPILTIPILGWSYTDLVLNLALSKAFLVLSPIIAVITMLTTSKPGDLFQALVRCGVPYKIAYIPILALRFLPTIINEVKLIIDAQESRALNLRKGNLPSRLRKYVTIFTPLMIRMMKSAIELGVALDSKGFGLSLQRTFSKNLRWEFRDTLFLIFGGLIYVLGLIFCIMPFVR